MTDTAITYSLANGKYGQGAGFNGTTSLITQTGTLGISGGAMSMVGWANLSVAPTSTNLETVFSQGDSVSHTYYDVRYWNNAGVMQLIGERVRNNTDVARAVFPTTISLGVWNHYAVTYDGANVLLYLNSILVAGPIAGSGNGASLANSGFSIGSYLDVPSAQNWNGFIDDVAIFNRALTPAEITVIFLEESKILKSNTLKPGIFKPGMAR